ncbi:MAG TPA: hypothetical protein VFQ67_07315 [Allosphingosinicella sp.]|jgi:hypothetical protein|nr:hypothetical protein [Allosphingosinicella sp.]
MPEFKVGQTEVRADGVIDVEVNPRNPLPVGAHRFQLVVEDDAGNVSQPTFLNVIVRDTDRPTAVLEMVDSNNKAVEPVVSAGRGFRLSGLRSTDNPPGKVVKYAFTLMDRP